MLVLVVDHLLLKQLLIQLILLLLLIHSLITTLNLTLLLIHLLINELLDLLLIQLLLKLLLPVYVNALRIHRVIVITIIRKRSSSRIATICTIILLSVSIEVVADGYLMLRGIREEVSGRHGGQVSVRDV